jgi:hypothetical protein
VNREEDKPKLPGHRPRRYSLLREKARRVELALFCGLLALLALVLLWSGGRFITTHQAYSGFLPITFDGVPALILGVVHVVTGAGILVATWAMWRLFR